MINGVLYLLFCFEVINVVEENFLDELVLVRRRVNCTRSVSCGFSI
jgi:hypothetical protein